MKILLYDANLAEPAISPVGMEYQAEWLRQRGHYSDLVDDIGNVDLKDYDLIGLGVRNIENTGFRPVEFYLPEIRGTISHIKSITDAPIVIGGSAVNIMPEDIRDYVGADCAVAGKGLEATERLMEAVKGGKGLPESIIDFSDFVKGRFKRDVIEHSKYKSVGIATKFGCPERCSYCVYPHIDGHVLRQREPSEVLYEIERLKDQGIKRVFFTDANFNISPEHGTEILKEINRRGIKTRWEAFINPSRYAFTDEFFEEVVKSGKRTIAFGVDALSKNGLKYLGKGFSLEDISRATRMCKSKGISIHYSVLFGHPEETEDDIREAFNNLDKLEPKFVDVVVGIRIMPGTRFYKECLDKGIIDKKTSLIEPPLYVPVDENLTELIVREAESRPNCHLSGIESLNMYAD